MEYQSIEKRVERIDPKFQHDPNTKKVVFHALKSGAGTRTKNQKIKNNSETNIVCTCGA